jgi:hypothetical protein
MLRRILHASVFAAGGLLASAMVDGCSSKHDDGGSGGAGNGGGSGNGGLLISDDGGGTLVIAPSSQVIDVNPTTGVPDPVQFAVAGKHDGDPEWDISNPAIGYIDPHTGLFTPNGKVGGEADITVKIGGQTGTTHITVNVKFEQNGATQNPDVDAGSAAGGLEGVGGEGFGDALTPAQLDALKGTASADAKVTMLYPYDQTVFPLDVLPPLLQWTAGGHGKFEGVAIHLSSPPYFDYKGTFGRPSRLAADADFVRHPIPKDVWKAATSSAAGSTLSVEMTLLAGGKAYGPIKQSYKIALAPFNGRIYYQAYATAFVKNWEPALTVWGERFGGATLSIDVGAESPKLVAGTNTDDLSGCRVCHSVSAYGDRMIVQHGTHEEYRETATYDLKNGNAQSEPYKPGTVSWAGLYPDGKLGLANSMNVTGSPSNDGDTKLYDMATGAVVPSPGLNEFATRIGLPAFSHDGKHAVFSFFEGPSTTAVGPANGRKLVAMDFNLATKTFSNPRLLWEAPANDQRPSFVTSMPTSDAVVFQNRWQGAQGNNDTFSTWHGALGNLWWVDLATHTAHSLDRVNGIGTDGKSYLPKGANNHDQDERLNYEPSISPVASGGYAWMVFMSRRQYGNVATSDPWAADPREHDIRKDITTKKLWMAAIDLNAKPGTDPSHPAFYIPGQEIQGVNSRPFLALQPCITDRGTCNTGIDCCTGFCRNGLCATPPVDECSKLDEKCDTAADCCDARNRCIGGFCANFVQ